MELKIQIPEKVEKILYKLNEHGYEAYVVGGCVRDSLLNREPGDWDITTSACPEEVKNLFDKTIDTGIQHGTVTILLGKDHFEVTTYRIDGGYEDHRRPKEVAYTKKLVEDLKRRDFTMNAMAYHSQEGIIDPFQGQKDMSKKQIRCVGKAEHRFKEDSLRMLRAVRFSAQLNFMICEETQKAIQRCAHLIQFISAERIHEEMNKLLLSNHPDRIMDLNNLNLMEYIIPEFVPCILTTQNHPYHQYTVGEHIIRSVQAIYPAAYLRWTMFFHDIGKPSCKTTDDSGKDHFYGHVEKSIEMASNIMERLKFDNKTKRQVLLLIELHDRWLRPDPVEIRKMMSRAGSLFPDVVRVQKADILAQSSAKIEDRIAVLDQCLEIYQSILSKKEATSIQELKVTGDELIQMEIPQGPIIGEILQVLLQQVLEKPELNRKEILLQIAKTYYSSI